jgi:hypothetical protein
MLSAIPVLWRSLTPWLPEPYPHPAPPPPPLKTKELPASQAGNPRKSLKPKGKRYSAADRRPAGGQPAQNN